MRNYAKIIAGLIAHAENEANPESVRAEYRAKAESLMREYRIEEEEAIATEGAESSVPVADEIVVMERAAWSNPLKDHYWSIWTQIAHHCGVRTAGKYAGSSWSDESKLTATAVGYEGDIRYAELLWTAARLVFLTRIDARVDRSLSDQENCYYMRGSGMSRKDIARALWGSEPTDGAAHGKVQKLYTAECTKREETPKVSGRGIQVGIYREAYARGFVNEIYWQLDAASSAVNKQSGALVMHGRKERVDEAFYNLFPHHRPMSAEDRAKYRAEAQAIIDSCQGCKTTKHASGACPTHRPTELSAAERRRQERMYNSAEASAGMRAGARAAKDVHIGRSGTPVRKTEAAPERSALGNA